MSARPTDRELRTLSLKLNDAYDQHRISPRPVKPDEVLIAVINIYAHKDYPRDKVYCSKCGAKRHKYGFTCVVATGERLLFGSDCGEEVFGEAWEKKAKALEADTNRQHELRQLDRIALIAKPMRDGLGEWFRLCKRMKQLRSDTAHALGELDSRLSEASNTHGGKLTVVRNVAATAARQGGMGGLRSEIEDIQAVADLSGAPFFWHYDPCVLVSACSDAIGAVLIGDTDGVSTDRLRRARKRFEDSLRGVEVAAQMYEGAVEFFTLASFKRVMDWNSRFRITRRGFFIEGDDIVDEAGATALGLPSPPLADLPAEPLELIREYRRSD